MGSTTRRNEEIVIGIIGLGSIGTRHIQKLKDLGVKKVVAMRTGSGTKKEIDSSIKDVIQTIDSFENFMNQKPEGIIIANPTSLHAETIAKFSNTNLPIFVEKPMISASSELSQISKVNKSNLLVGYCLRFHPIIQELKKLLAQNKIGPVFLAKLNAGHYLPDWHPYTDYTKEYYSRKNLGGGVLRTLSHEIDLMIHLFGLPDSFESACVSTSDLKIDVDDFATVLARCGKTVTRVEIDFLNLESKRDGILFGEKGELHYNFSSQTVFFIDRATKLKTQMLFDKSVDMYEKQMNSFLDFIKSRERSLFCNFNEAKKIAEIIDNTKNINT